MTDTLVAQRGHTVLAGLERRLADSRRSKEIFAQLLAAEAPVVDAVAVGESTGIAQRLVPLRARLGLEEIHAYDATGRLLLRLAPGEHTWDTAGLVTAARSGITSSTVAVVQQGVRVAAAAPLKDADGIVGAIVVARTFETDSFEELTGNQDIHLAVFHGRDLLALSDRVAGGVTYERAVSEPRIIAGRYAPVSLGLGDAETLVALVDVEDVLTARKHRQYLMILGTLFVSAAAVAGGIRMSRRITRPVDRMMEVALTIGRGHYDQRLPRYEIVELDALAATINQLAASVDERVTGQMIALKDLDQRFRSSFESATIGMALLTVECGFLSINPALQAMLGYDTEEVSALTLADVAHPDDRDGLLVGMQGLAAGTEAALRSTTRCVRADGQVMWAELGVVAVRDAEGTFRYHVAHIEDVTARRHAEMALALSEQRWRHTFESAAAGVTLIGPEYGTFIEVNQAACDMLGYDEAELMAMTIHDICHPADRHDWMQEFSHVAFAETATSHTKMRYVRRDGSTGHAMVSLGFVRDTHEHPLHVVGQFIDISDRVEAERQLVELLASKEQLVASVSHELRTPLTAIVGYAQLLNDAELQLSPADQKEMIQSIAAEGVDLSNIIDDLLAAARAESGQLTVGRVSLDLASQVDQVLAAAARGFNGKKVEFVGGSARVLGDPSRIRQIIRNLVSNGIRYGGDHIQITIRDLTDTIELVVADDGPGVPEERREAIFQPYQRAHQREGLTASVGLGLTVSRQLAVLMEGDLTYRFEHGRSMFVLALQRDAESEARGDLVA